VIVACRDAGFEPDVTHQVDDFATSLHLVQARQGVAMIPDLGLIHLAPSLRAVDISPPVSRLVQLAYRTTNVDRPAIVAVQQALIEIVDQLGLTQPKAA
jgi:DNA-binding transcriptional LysR family regulator